MDVKELNQLMLDNYLTAGDDGDGVVCCIFDGGANEIDILDGRIEAGNERGLQDDLDHGTSTCSLIALLPKVRFISYNVFPKGKFSKTAYMDALADMLKRMQRDKKRRYVANMSFGGGGYFGESTIDKIDELGKAIVAAGGSFACSAGNDDAEIKKNRFPAAYQWPFTVTALTVDGKRAHFSSWLNEADFSEWGVGVPCRMKDGKRANRDGTSFSSPILCRKMICTLSRAKRLTGKWLTDDELYEAMKGMAVDLGVGGLDPYFGWGFVDLLKEGTNTMKKIYLSASTQEKNPCAIIPGVDCKTEEQHCQAMMDTVADRLKAHGFSIKRNTPSMTWESSYLESNAWGAEMLLCLHTNGSNKPTTRGAYWAYITKDGKDDKLAKLLADYTSMDGVKVSAADKTGADGFGEMDNSTAKHVAYAELGYHSSPEDHAWLHRNMPAIVEGIVKAVCAYAGVKYVGSMPEQPTEPPIVTPVAYPATYYYAGASFVNLRDKPGGNDIGDVKSGHAVVVLGVTHTDQDWAEVVDLDTMQRGWCVMTYLKPATFSIKIQ